MGSRKNITLLKQVWLAFYYNRHANKMLRRFADTDDIRDRIVHADLLRHLASDNKRFKGLRPFVRNQVARFYKSARTFTTYEAIDYTEAKYHYQRNKELGVDYWLDAAFYLNKWVTVVSNHAVYKGKKYGEYNHSYWVLGPKGFTPFTFLVTDTYKKSLGGDDKGYGVDKNQIRLATEEEIQSVIDKQFILSEN